MRNSGRLPLLVGLLVVVETLNVGAVATVIGGWVGVVIGLVFAALAAAGVFIRPNSPKWVNPVWSVLSLPVNAAVIGKWALMTGVVLFGDVLIGWAVVMAIFVIVQGTLVFAIRKLV